MALHHISFQLLTAVMLHSDCFMHQVVARLNNGKHKLFYVI